MEINDKRGKVAVGPESVADEWNELYCRLLWWQKLSGFLSPQSPAQSHVEWSLMSQYFTIKGVEVRGWTGINTILQLTLRLTQMRLPFLVQHPTLWMTFYIVNHVILWTLLLKKIMTYLGWLIGRNYLIVCKYYIGWYITDTNIINITLGYISQWRYSIRTELLGEHNASCLHRFNPYVPVNPCWDYFTTQVTEDYWDGRTAGGDSYLGAYRPNHQLYIPEDKRAILCSADPVTFTGHQHVQGRSQWPQLTLTL